MARVVGRPSPRWPPRWLCLSRCSELCQVPSLLGLPMGSCSTAAWTKSSKAFLSLWGWPVAKGTPLVVVGFEEVGAGPRQSPEEPLRPLAGPSLWAVSCKAHAEGLPFTCRGWKIAPAFRARDSDPPGTWTDSGGLPCLPLCLQHLPRPRGRLAYQAPRIHCSLFAECESLMAMAVSLNFTLW